MKTKTINQEAAFPMYEAFAHAEGLAKRELFAAMAMQAQAHMLYDLPREVGTIEEEAKAVADIAVIMADALLAELAKEGK